MLRLAMLSVLALCLSSIILPAQSGRAASGRAELMIDSVISRWSIGPFGIDDDDSTLAIARTGVRLDSTCTVCWLMIGGLSEVFEERLVAHDRVLALTSDKPHSDAYLVAMLWRGMELLSAGSDEDALRDLGAFLARLSESGPEQGWIRRYVTLLFTHPYFRATPSKMVGLADRIRRQPEDAHALFQRGAMNEEIGDSLGALSDFTRSLELQPDQHGCRLKRATLLLEMGRADDAHRDYDQLIAMEPAHVRALTLRGQHHWKLGDTAAAIEDLHAAMVADTNDSEPAWRYGNLLIDAGRYREAVEFYASIVAGKRGTADSTMRSGALAEIGRAHYLAGEYEESIAASRSAFALDSSATAGYRIGLALLRIGRTAEALQQYRSIRPQYFEEDEAIAELRKLTGIKSQESAARRVLKEVFEVLE